MKRVAAFTAALLATALLDCGSAYAQARGASAKETREKGQPIKGDTSERWVIYKGNLIPQSVRNKGKEAVQRYIERTKELANRDGQAALMHALDNADEGGREAVKRFVDEPLEPGADAATRANEVLELETWLRRMPGRFRIGGRITMQDTIGGGIIPIPLVLAGEISGVADCAAVGEGVGVQCILNATWPVIDLDVQQLSRWSTRASPSEGLKTLQPAMLVLGLDLELPGIWALMVSDATHANAFTGKLTDNTLAALGLLSNGCLAAFEGCLSEMKIGAEPDSEIVTITLIKPLSRLPDQVFLRETDHPDTDPLKVPPEDALIITLVMHRDPEAQPVVPMKTKKVR